MLQADDASPSTKKLKPVKEEVDSDIEVISVKKPRKAVERPPLTSSPSPTDSDLKQIKLKEIAQRLAMPVQFSPFNAPTSLFYFSLSSLCVSLLSFSLSSLSLISLSFSHSHTIIRSLTNRFHNCIHSGITSSIYYIMFARHTYYCGAVVLQTFWI